MRTPIFQIDAFTTRRFAGNPAAVVLLQSFPEDVVMQAIAAENNLAETAFLVPADMVCRLADDRVEMEGAFVFYLEGEVEF
jgi:PhzF family phenazine biosynthesis protein